MQVLSARVLLRPADFDASVTFYEFQLGLVRYRDWGEPSYRGVVYFLGGGYLELTETAPDEDPGPAPAGARLWLQVPDVAGACEDLDRAGVTISAAPERKVWGLIEASVHDPDGLELILVETPVDHPLRRRQ